MIKATNNLLDETSYNKLTIISAIIVSILSYFTWEYSVGIMVWFLYFTLAIAITASLSVPTWHIIFAMPLAFFLLAGGFYSFVHNFWDTLFLRVENVNIVYDLALTIKQGVSHYPEFGSICIGLMFLLLFWAHPNPEGEKHIAYNPLKLLEYKRENPAKFNHTAIKFSIICVAAFIGGKAIATIMTWYFLYSIVRFLYFDACIRSNDATPKKFTSYLIVYCIVAFSYGIFVTDKTPVDALIGIITMTP